MRGLITLIILIGTSSLYGQEGIFEYNNKVIVKYAITALEEYNNHNPKTSSKLGVEYELDNSISYGRLVTNCEGEKVRVIMVAFPSKDKERNASVHLTYSKDNYFGEILNRQYSIGTAQEAIEAFKNLDFGEFLFACGL